MLNVIKATKEAGGDLMVSTVRALLNGKAVSTPNEADDGNYYSWPTIEEVRAFKRNGGRLI